MNQGMHLEWLYSRYSTNVSKLGLSRIELLCSRLGNPEKELKHVVHVGGTNGKGSTARLLSHVLRCAGYSVGTYLSPHLHCFNERFLIDCEMVSDEELEKFLLMLKPVVEQLDDEGVSPTFFEIATVLAFLIFKRYGLDFCIIEVGLGGRFDATNVVSPDVCVITNISLEHTQLLGTTTEKIAFEKAGIIKSGVPIITATSDKKALLVISSVAESLNAPLEVISKKDWTRLKSTSDMQTFQFNNDSSFTVSTSMLGLHQGENIALALRTVEVLVDQGSCISKEDIEKGIVETKNPGRMEVLGKSPLVVVDGAHNPGGVKALVKTLKKDFRHHRLVLIVGLLQDKNFEEILDVLLPVCNCFVATLPPTPRGRNPQDLVEYAKKSFSSIETSCSESVSDALKLAFSLAEKDDLICVTGSLFTVGEARYLLSSTLERS